MSNVNLMVGDCVERMRSMADNSVDSIVTDPPYLIGFMGKEWDHKDGIAGKPEVWRECLRVLKPGGHLLSFAGARTYHRIACAIEDAGFEVRDQIMWVYGSGFPKSLDVSKAIDKAAGAVREVIGQRKNNKGDSGTQTYAALGAFKQEPFSDITTPATEVAQQWQGWGTALKPAHEPICVARKPLTKGNTVAANVLHWGTGALNIDASRVVTADKLGGGNTSADVDRTGKHEGWQRPWMADADAAKAAAERSSASVARSEELGRWPANLIHDGSDEVVACLPNAQGQRGKITGKEPSAKTSAVYGEFSGRNESTPRNEDDKSAARFFYCAKTSKKDRGEGNTHPTVKPADLMRYLVRLVTPPDGVVLDPFMGSGSTGKAAIAEGFDFIGIDMDEAYVAIAKARMGVAPEVVGEFVGA